MSDTNDTSADGDASGDEDEFVWDPESWDPTKAHLQYQALKSTNQGGDTPLQEWHVVTQPAPKVQKNGNPYFKKHIDACVDGILTFVADNKAMKSGGGFGSQNTIEDFGGTVTIDFQGLRENQGYAWFDFQGQVGGGSTTRNTYFQVMVLRDLGEGPTAAMIGSAIRDSLKGGTRSIVVLRSVQARPK